MDKGLKTIRAQKAKKILDILEKAYPGATIALRFKNPLELLVATILSAQATDKLVNQVTERLFKKYRSAADYAAAGAEAFERDISSVNFYRNKAKSIRNCARMIVEDFNGEVPATLEDLVKLPGVGRKTANVVLANAFGIPALAVDTHVKRVSRRLGLASSEVPDEIEAELTSIIEKRRWAETTTLFILHGRTTCKARKPLCEDCPVNAYCDYYKEAAGKGPAC
ncbi:MAG: endonuclease III [Thermodesulfobacteriota bacterium]|nr:MAG: endonuclease III [Thermodesulfobacteriota bacterium]